VFCAAWGLATNVAGRALSLKFGIPRPPTVAPVTVVPSALGDVAAMLLRMLLKNTSEVIANPPRSTVLSSPNIRPKRPDLNQGEYAKLARGPQLFVSISWCHIIVSVYGLRTLTRGGTKLYFRPAAAKWHHDEIGSASKIANDSEIAVEIGARSRWKRRT